MPDTVFITGSSSGIGRAAAELFHTKGWNVVATMRRPESEQELSALERVLVTRLDVTDSSSIQSAVARAIERFGGIDVLVNNAGYGAYGPLEVTPREKIVRQLETNVIGPMETIKAVLPHFRERRSGVIVNVSSMGGRVGGPLGTLYYASKFALEGMSESLTFEASAIGVKVKIVEPGRVDTDFNSRSMDISNDPPIAEYQGVAQAMMAGTGEGYRSGTDLPAEVIYRAATDDTDQLRYPSGDDAHEAIAQRKTQEDEVFFKEARKKLGLA